MVIDQAIKLFMVEFVENREGRDPTQIVGSLLQINVIRNPGAAFGFGGGLTIVFSLVALVVAVVVIRQARTMTSRAWAIALGALLGGAIGNLIDRLFREPGFGSGAVVDYVDVQYFAIFNLADASLTLSAIGIAVLALKGVPMGPETSANTHRADEAPHGPADEAPEGQPPYSGS